ncbi:MAG: glycosyltransferase, partial [Acidimicrobiales bacterium]
LDPFFAVSGPSGALRRQLCLSSDTPLVGAVGRCVAIKDLNTLLEAVARLPGVHVAIIGDGDERPSLEAHAAGLGLNGRAHFCGWFDGVPAAMSDLDVVALTSRNEGTPVALIEALAARRPVVATDVGGVRFVIEDGVTGLLAPKADAVAFAEQLDRALRNRAAMAAMAARGREHVAGRFTGSRLVADIRSLYTELLQT